jgi:Tol biopolymer transport system component
MARLLRPVAFIAAFCLALAPAHSAEAQYFGRNKVQYKKLDFQTLKTEHFDIYFYPEEREGIDVAARMAERWHARLEQLFAHKLRGRQPLILYGSHADFEQTNVIPGELGEGTGGVTEPLKRRIVLPLAGPLGDTDHVIGHELVHAFQFDMMTGPNVQRGVGGAAERLPLWFIEGMAEYFSLGPVDPNTAMWLRDAVKEEKLPSIDDLDNPKYFPYRWGQAFWAYVGGRFGDDAIARIMKTAALAGDAKKSLETVLKVPTKQLSADWQAAIRQAYEPILAGTTPPAEIGRTAIAARGLGAELNVGPAISPDGKLIAFLSERSVFSTDLFIADAATGTIVRKLTSTATDPHFSSIQFIYSAGGWDPSGRKIAIATVTAGHPALTIFDAASGSKERELDVAGVDEIFNPTWAPDGHAVAFTGMSHGLTDLYLLDLNSSRLERLTNDAYADLMPAWSPDGRSIAFATDRFSSNLSTLAFGSYRLALIDPDTRAVEQVGGSFGGAAIDPQWTPDGRSLDFISDRDGIANLYRMTLATGALVQLTHASTGLSGITSTSPALSVAAQTGAACFSVYHDGKYEIHVLDADERGGPPDAPSMRAATLPPADRPPSTVSGLLADASTGLPANTASFQTTAYHPAFSLEGVAQPTIAVGASSFGAAVGGGIALQFGDVLGDHTLATAVQLNGGLGGGFSAKNTAAQALYYNAAHRWNWGLVGGQIPYLSAAFGSAVGIQQGEPVEIDETLIQRQTERSAAGIVAYPFDRARRVEFQGGVSQISFDQIVETSAISLNTGQLLSDNTAETPLGRSLNLATTSAAFVFDTSNFGATSPVSGQSYRFQVAPTVGSINFSNLLADYRRYFMPVPFYTIAVRGLHYGRYGSGAEDPRLTPLFLGYPNLVRGYDTGVIDASACSGLSGFDCSAFDRLLGSRLLVANVELRFPLLRPFGASQRMYGPVPVELAFFADGGTAWSRGQRPTIFGGDRDGVSSAGVTLRVNLFGYAVGQFDFARPFQQPANGWVFQFNLSPGF